MYNYWILILIPIIASLIGWITNKLAIWMLYNPKEPMNILGFTIQGIFPKRQIEISIKIGELVAENLLSVTDLKNQIFTPTNLSEVRIFIEGKLSDYLNNDLKEKHPFMSLFVRQKQKDKIKHEVLSKLDSSLSDLNENFTYYLEKKIDIKQMVTDKVASLDTDEINTMMQNVLKKELLFIEYIGAVIGFLVGVIQVLFVLFL